MDPIKSAKSLLDLTWDDRGFPVDPVTIARSIGVEVLELDLPADVSGALIKEEGKDPAILLHRPDSNKRKRFSCAHELGHYMARVESSDSDTEYEYIDLRSDKSSTGTNGDEVSANRFAANLLMPEGKVKQLHNKNKGHIEMAMFFGVSNESIKYRLKNLNLL